MLGDKNGNVWRIPLLTHLDRLWTRAGHRGTGGGGGGTGGTARCQLLAAVPTFLDKWLLPGDLGICSLMPCFSASAIDIGIEVALCLGAVRGFVGSSEAALTSPHEMPIPAPNHGSETLSRPCPQVKTTAWSGPTTFAEIERGRCAEGGMSPDGSFTRWSRLVLS